VHIDHAALLFFAALAAGALNSVAGGGSFITFPALLFTGMNAIAANATNTVAVWPGTVASVFAYRRELRDKATWKLLAPLFAVTVVGSIAGAILLLKTPEKTFTTLIPFLLGLATLVFTFGPSVRIAKVTRSPIVGTLLQLAVALYIGYFGAGAGILMLALFSLIGMKNIHTMNAFKTLLATLGNGIAVVTFIVARKVVWPEALVMMAGAAIGGYGGAFLAQRVDPKRVRWIVIAIGCAMTIYFAVKRF
jgi:uncharacterized membrane protein YfcA